MSVIISNITFAEPDDQDHTYVLSINNRQITVFQHRRDEGLAMLLVRAAAAVQTPAAKAVLGEIRYTTTMESRE